MVIRTSVYFLQVLVITIICFGIFYIADYKLSAEEKMYIFPLCIVPALVSPELIQEGKRKIIKAFLASVIISFICSLFYLLLIKTDFLNHWFN